MEAIKELHIFRESESISDSIWKDVLNWELFCRDTIGKELVNSIDSVNASIAESHSHRSRHGRMHYLYTARGLLFKTLVLVEKASRRELALAPGVRGAVERLLPHINEYIAQAERAPD